MVNRMSKDDIFALWMGGNHPAQIAEDLNMTVLEVLNILHAEYLARRDV